MKGKLLSDNLEVVGLNPRMVISTTEATALAVHLPH